MTLTSKFHSLFSQITFIHTSIDLKWRNRVFHSSHSLSFSFSFPLLSLSPKPSNATVRFSLSTNHSLSDPILSDQIQISFTLCFFGCSESFERNQGVARVESSVRLGWRRSLWRWRSAAVVRRHLLHSRRLQSRHRIV